MAKYKVEGRYTVYYEFDFEVEAEDELKARNIAWDKVEEEREEVDDQHHEMEVTKIE